jgi:hypothetical protein
VVEAARTLTAKLNPADPVGEAYRHILGRLPSTSERGLAGRFLKHSPMKEFCRALFNLNEFVYVF